MLENLRDSLGVQGIVEIMGSTDDVGAALAELDIFAYTTTGTSCSDHLLGSLFLCALHTRGRGY